MTDQERAQVLKMIETGRITPEEGLKLMQTLDENPVIDEIKSEPTAEVPESVSEERANENGSKTEGEKSNFEIDPRIARVKSVARRLWQIPLWLGVLITILSAWGMYALVQANRLNFWFVCLIFLLLVGVLVIAAAVGSRKARWIFVDVHQSPNEKPARIFLGFPLPLKFAAWFLRTFGHFIPNLGSMNLDEMIQAVETGLTGKDPLVVNVDEGENGDRVQIYIG
jgi:hypothetical protein